MFWGTILFSVNLFGLERPTICLNMIVKNEARVIERCLDSLKPLIDYWIISDTGSIDGTQEIIRRIMKDIPGELYEDGWQDFAYNRTLVLNRSKGRGDFVLFIDADEMFEYPQNFRFLNLDCDHYLMCVKNEANGCIQSEYLRVMLVNNHLKWRWEGVIHEDIYCQDADVRYGGELKGIWNISRKHEGARAFGPEKYLKDAAVLEKALEKEPNNTRYQYYLASSYYNAGKYEEALRHFEKRIALEPDRAGSREIYQLGCYLCEKNNLFLAELVLKQALILGRPTGARYVWNWIYDWALFYKLAECCFKLGHFQDAKWALEQIDLCTVPAQLLEEMQNNYNTVTM